MTEHDHERIAAVRAVMAQIVDVESLNDEEVLERAEAIDGSVDAAAEVQRDLDAPLEPAHLPPLDPAVLADAAAFQAELRFALRGGGS